MGNVPTISFRDLAIQRRENDLVGASFGRGFYVLDDYSVLREFKADDLEQEASLYSTRKAWWYIPRPVLDFGDEKGSQGASYYTAPNPPFGAVFTYYLRDDLKTKKTIRQAAEKKLEKASEDIPFPGWDEVEAERRQQAPKIWLTVKDSEGAVVRKIRGPAQKGFHRVAWDLKYPKEDVIRMRAPTTEENLKEPGDFMAAPGTYTVSLSKEVDGVVTALAGPVTFEVERLHEGALEGATPEAAVAFWKELYDLRSAVSQTSIELQNTLKKVDAMQRALRRAPAEPGALDGQIHALRAKLLDLDEQLNGNRSKQEPGEKTRPTVNDRLYAAYAGTLYSTYGPTESHRRSMEIGREAHEGIREDLAAIVKEDIPQLMQQLKEAGAPEIEGTFGID
jgi:hypothetical protein